MRYGQPVIFEVEPDLKCDYRPDVFMIRNGKRIFIELQLTRISNKKMQDKINRYTQSFYLKHHNVDNLWIVTDHLYNLSAPDGFNIQFHKWNLDEEKEINL